jgi:hypothetical protein
MERRMSSFKVIAAGASWRMFGSRRAAKTLLAAMSEGDEQTRMLAGMSLVKAGRRSFDLIEEQVEAGQASASLVGLLPDIDGERARGVLEKIACGDDSELRDTAGECVDLLDRIDAQNKWGHS